MGWHIQSTDIIAAFLQGNELEREIFPRPPPDVCSKEFVWSLKCYIYGLNNASSAWYERIRAEFNGMLIGILVTLMILHLLEAKTFTPLLLKCSRRLSK